MPDEISLHDELLSTAKITLGHAEAEDKKSFVTGAEVGISITKRHFEPMIENYKKALDYEQQRFEELENDIKTLVGILQKYSSIND